MSATMMGETKSYNNQHVKIYVVLHGDSTTAREDIVDNGKKDNEEKKENFVTIGSIKKKIKNNNLRLRVFRASQPNSVFMSNHEINVDIRENYVGNPYFPGFGTRTMSLRTPVQVPRSMVDNQDSDFHNPQGLLLRLLQIFKNNNDELFNERLKTDVGETNNEAKESNQEFGIWIKYDNNWIKLMSNRDEFFLDINGSPKYIRIDELISEIYRKIKNNLNENCILDVFFANCSPPIMHEKTQRLQRVETEDGQIKRFRMLESNCGSTVKWFNAFCIECKRIKIFLDGRRRFMEIFNRMPHPEQGTKRLTEMLTPPTVVDIDERASLYKNIICILKNINNFIYDRTSTNAFRFLPNKRYRENIIKNNLKFLLYYTFLPLHYGGIAQLSISKNTDKENFNTLSNTVFNTIDSEGFGHLIWKEMFFGSVKTKTPLKSNISFKSFSSKKRNRSQSNRSKKKRRKTRKTGGRKTRRKRRTKKKRK